LVKEQATPRVESAAAGAAASIRSGARLA